jgi:hypothetical protein
VLGLLVGGAAGVVATRIWWPSSIASHTAASTASQRPPAPVNGSTSAFATDSTASVSTPAHTGALTAGTYVVGHDISAGTYRSDRGDASCAWARLRADNSIVSGHGDGHPITIIVSSTDKALELQGGCRYARVP